jgi:peptidoglycan/LPS O-acetylase OafA/YrhL
VNLSRRWVAVAVVAVAMLMPKVALACPVCFDPRDENRFAFLGTTIFLSLLPLGMVGAMVTWVRQRSRKLDEDEQNPVESTPQ